MSRSLPAAAHRAARPPALGSRPDADDLLSPPLAASIRQNIPFPAAPPAHPGACEHWHHITDQSPIRPSSTTAATTPLSSPALSSQRSSRNHPPLQPLRRQIPIVGQALTAFPRVPSSEAFRRRPLTPGSTIRARPPSETLTECGRSPDDDQPSQVGRVEMWRGDGRLNISVCRPFRLAVP